VNKRTSLTYATISRSQSLTIGVPVASRSRKSAALLLPSLLGLLLGGCAFTSGPQTPSSQLDTDIQHAPRSSLGQSVSKKSSALLSYLRGEIALQSNDSETAIANFSKAKQLFEGPVPTLHSQLADLYLGALDLEASLQEINAALADEGDNNESLLLKALLLHTLGKQEEAETAYRAAIARTDSASVSPQTAEKKTTGAPFEPELLLGVLLIEEERFQDAAQILGQAVKDRPREGIATYYLARSLEGAGQFQEALAAYSQTLALEPRNPYPLIDSARVLAKLGKAQEIKERCNQLLKADPAHQTAKRILLLISNSSESEALEKLRSVDSTPITIAEAQFRLALASVRQQNHKTALRFLRLILAKDPSNAEARYNLAAVLSSTGDVKEAANELWKIESDSPLFVKSRTFAAFLLRQNRDFAGAERAIREALSTKETDTDVLSFLVVILKESRQFDKARDLLETQLKKTPNDGKLLFSYGSLLHEMGDFAGSLTAMERVIADDPNNSDALNFVAFALAKKNEDLDRALTLIERALSIRPNDGFYLDTLGCIQLRQGQSKDSEASFSRAVQLTSEDP
jgi:tetratricopeptide (TPR) repeat protein